MPWFVTDDQMHDHPKVLRLGKDILPAMGLWQLAGSWAAGPTREGDGFVSQTVLRRWDTARFRYARRLVDVGLWIEGEFDEEPGFFFHDWLDYQPSAADKAVKRIKLAERKDRDRAATRERVRKHRAGRKAAPAAAERGNETITSPRTSVPSFAELDERTTVMQATAPPVDDWDYTHSELDELDSMTAGQRQCNADRNALRNGVPGIPVPVPTSRDLGGEAYVGTAHELGSPPPQDQLGQNDQDAALVADPARRYAGQQRPTDADPAICDRHWHLRYREVWEPVPNCRDCQRQRQDLADQASAAVADAEAIRQREKAIRAACTACDEFGWLLDENGRPLSNPAVKHDCVAAAAERRGHLRVVGG